MMFKKDSEKCEASNTVPLIRLGWMRVLLCLIAYVLLWLLLRSWAQGPVSMLAARMSGVLGIGYLQWLGALFSLSTIHLPMIVSVSGFRWFVDRGSMRALGFGPTALPQKVGFGMLTGGLAVACVFFISLQIGTVELTNGPAGKAGGSFGLACVRHFVLAFAEELLMLGYVVMNLRNGMGKTVAVLVSALIFAVAHGLNPNLSVVGGANLFLMGAAMALYYVRTNDLIGPIAAHWMWNVVQGPVLGYNVSGTRVVSLFEQTTTGSELLTGGAFGFEGSLLTTGALLIIVALILFLRGRSQSITPPHGSA